MDDKQVTAMAMNDMNTSYSHITKTYVTINTM